MKTKAILAVASIVSLLIILVGCGSTSTTNNAKSESTTDNGNVVYILTSKENTYNANSTADKYELDEQGNVVEITEILTFVSDELPDVVDRTEYLDFTEEGYPKREIRKLGEKEWVNQYEITTNGDTASEIKNTSMNSTKTYTYHPNGVMATERSYTGTASGDNYNTMKEYDENGYLLKITMNKSGFNHTIDWEFGANNLPVGYTDTYVSNNDGKTTVHKYTVKCDDNGNIVRIESAEDGRSVTEYSYTKIENPSKAAWVAAKTKQVDVSL